MHFMRTRNPLSPTALPVWCCGIMLAVMLSAAADEALLDTPEFQRAVSAYNDKQFEEAKTLFRTLARQFPDNAIILNNLAVISIHQNDTTNAINLLKRTIETDTTINVAYHNLSAIYAYLASLSYREALSLESLDPHPLRLDLIYKTVPDTPAQTADVAGDVMKAPETNMPLVRDPKAPETNTPAIRNPKASISESENHNVMAAVKAWAQAWSDQNPNAYFSSYIDGYTPQGDSHRDWKTQRTKRLTAPKFIDVTIFDIRSNINKKKQAKVTFIQKYRSNTLSSQVTKQLNMRNVGNAWKITEEKIL